MTKSKEEFENIVYQSLKENNGFSENPGNIFNPFFECIASAALKEIEYKIAVMKIPGRPAHKILDLGVLKEILIKVSKRVLIYDMNVRREAGELAGDSGGKGICGLRLSSSDAAGVCTGPVSAISDLAGCDISELKILYPKYDGSSSVFIFRQNGFKCRIFRR